MTLVTEILNTPSEFEKMKEAWERLVTGNAGTIQGHDATSSFAWFSSLQAAFPVTQKARMVVVREGDDIVALLPVVAESARLGCPRLFVPTVVFGGRNGFLISEARVDVFCALLQGLERAFGRWQSLHFWGVIGSESDKLLSQVCAEQGYGQVRGPEAMTPYFPLLDSPETFFTKMAKDLRKRIKSAANKLNAMGLVDSQVIRAENFESSLNAILAIERGSWKHEAGTAISCHPDQERFYRALFPRAIEAGLLYGKILYLNAAPIAHSFGLVSSGTFISLKSSQLSEFERLNPGHLLSMGMMSDLRAQGVETYDFMGGCEPHKLRWSESTGFYARRPVWLYSPSLCGRGAFAVHRSKLAFSEAIRRLKSTYLQIGKRIKHSFPVIR